VPFAQQVHASVDVPPIIAVYPNGRFGISTALARMDRGTRATQTIRRNGHVSSGERG
jgi:hypothetical protein